MSYLSIIIDAVHSTDEQLLKTIESIKKQTFSENEIIIVSEKHLQNPLFKDFNFVSGYFADGALSRYLKGISEAKGDYFLFAKSGETYSIDHFRKLISELEKGSAELAISEWVLNGENGLLCPKHDYLLNNDIVYDGESGVENFILQEGHCFSFELLQNKIFTRQLFNRIKDHANKLCSIDSSNLTAFALLLFGFSKKTINVLNRPVFINSLNVGSKVDFSADKKTENVFAFLKETLSNLKSISALDVWFKHLSENKEEFQCALYDFGKEYFEFEKIIEGIRSDSTKIVSFDIFDTLIMRGCLIPTDVFDILGQMFVDKLSSAFALRYKELRRESETVARTLFKNQELTIDDIYDYMVNTYGFSKELANELKQAEIKLELDLAEQRKTGKDLYDIAELYNKRIIYTSDMYLSGDNLYAMLEKNGYKRDYKLYLSSKYKLSKNDCSMFDLIFEEEKITASDMIHIGDNQFIDFEQPRDKKGIKTFVIPNVNNLFMQNERATLFNDNVSLQDPREYDTFVGLRLMCGVAANKLYDFPFFHRISEYNSSPRLVGYYLLGMYLYAYDNWLVSLSNKTQTLHFVARDGWLPFKAFEIFKSHYKNIANPNYLYLSRKFLYPLAIYNKQDLFSSIEQIAFHNQSLKSVLSYFPDSCLVKENIAKINEAEYSRYFGNQDNFMKSVNKNADCINFNELANYRSLVAKKFLSDVHNNDFIIDSGYTGRNESILAKLLNINLNSVYFHSRADIALFNFDKSKTKSYSFYDYVPRVSYDIREIAFANLTTSLVKYDDVKDELVFKTVKSNADMKLIVSTLQNNALSFVNDFLNKYSKYSNSIMYLKDSAILPWETYLYASRAIDRDFFNSFVFENDMGNGDHHLTDLWASMSIKGENNITISQPIPEKKSFAKKVANKLLPKGSKRREFVKKILRK